MNITRTAKFENGKLVYDPPYTADELQAQADEFAAMCQSRRAPIMKGSDRGFLEGDVIHHGLQSMPEFMQQHHVAKARKAGISIAGKVYKAGLADQRGAADPEAWVGGSDDVLRVCKKRNLSCQGAVNHQGQQVPEPDGVAMSERCIAEMAEKYVAQDPDWQRKPHELREMVIEKHGNPAKKRRGEKSVEKMTKAFKQLESIIGSD